MTRKLTVVDTLSDFFAMHGKIYTLEEYSKLVDKPLSVQAIKRTCGSWVRMLAIAERAFPDRMAIAAGVQEESPPPPVEEDPPKLSAKQALSSVKVKDE